MAKAHVLLGSCFCAQELLPTFRICACAYCARYLFPSTAIRFGQPDAEPLSPNASLLWTQNEHIADFFINCIQVSDTSKVGPSAHFSNDLGLDSLDTVEVVMAIEEEFSIEIPDKDADAIHSGKSMLQSVRLDHSWCQLSMLGLIALLHCPFARLLIHLSPS